jgi:hypothetical protein
MFLPIASPLGRFPSLFPQRVAQPATRALTKSLFRAGRFGIESLRRPAVRSAPVKEAIMLDVAFVALGIVVLALMGVYALALRQP